MKFFPKHRQAIFLTSVLGLGLVLSIAGFVAVRSDEVNDANDAFEDRTSARALDIKNEFEADLAVLINIRSLYSSSDVIEREGFNRFVAGTLSENPNIQALEWIPRVTAAQRLEHEEAGRSDGYPGYQIVERQSAGVLVPAAPRREHFPVFFVEPFEGNEAALGFDLASNPARLKALIKSPIGMLAVPYFIIFEMFSPVLELVGIGLVIASFALGYVNLPFFGLFVAVTVLFGSVLTTGSVLLEEISFRRYLKTTELLKMIAAGLAENLGYRQLNLWWRASGCLDYLRGKTAWGRMERRGFGKRQKG